MKNKIAEIIKVLMASLLFSGCTYSINMVHTSGSASDVIDEDQSPSADVDADLTIPATIV